MTTELLWPRYKVIADYPGNNQAVGTIIQLYEATNAVVIEQMYFYDKYPYLFQKLEWWMDRKPEDLPQYIQYVRDGKKMAAYKIHGWNIEKGYAICERGEDYPLWLQKHTIPITDTEYEVYQATLKQQ